MKKEQFSELLILGSGQSLYYDINETFIDAFLSQVEKTPYNIAVVDEYSSLTYADLNRYSDILAAELIKSGVKEGHFVAIKLPRVKEFLVSVIGIWKAGAAYVPIDPSYPNSRIRYMLEDSDTSLIIDESNIKSLYGDREIVPSPINLSKASSVALMVYTSGSTGTPKGVLNTHAGLRSLCEWIPDFIGYNSGSNVAEYATFSFVQSCNDLYPPLTVGACVHILSTAVQHDLCALNAYLISNKIKYLRVTSQIASALMTSFDIKLNKIVVGGDKAQIGHLGNTRLITSYGCSETCGSVANADISDSYTDSKPLLGRPMPGVTIVLEDPAGNPIPRGEIGEVCISSRQVAIGYHNFDKATKEHFVHREWSDSLVFRSGDLARWNEEGFLEFHGRADNMVKIRGFRIELGEVEEALNRIEGIVYSAVVVRELAEEPILCAYYTSSTPIDEKKIRSMLSLFLPDFMIPSVIQYLEKMPKLPNGKLDYHSLPALSVLGDIEIVPPGTEFELAVFNIVSDLLNTTTFGITTNLMSIGLTSMRAIRLSLYIKQQLGVYISALDIINSPYIKGWANIGRNEVEEIPKEKPMEFYPLAENQMGIFIDWEQNRDGLQYNLPFALKINGADAERLLKAVKLSINLHPLLKTHIIEVNGELKQHRRDNAEIPVLFKCLDFEPQPSFFQSIVRPFNILGEDLSRFIVYATPQAAYIFFDIHHIIFDGGSANVFLKSIASFYMDDTPDKEIVTAYDYNLYVENKKGSKAFVEAKEFFHNLILGTESFFYPSVNGGSATRVLSVATAVISRKTILKMCRTSCVTENTFFATLLTQFLKKFSRENKIQIATISSGRSVSQLANSVGMFVQTLPLLSVEGKGSIVATLKQMQSQITSILRYDYYSYTLLSKEFGIKPNVLYAYQGDVMEGASFDGVTPIRYKMEMDTAISSMLFNITPNGDEYEVELRYDSGLYEEAQMHLFVQTFANYSLQVASSNSDNLISSIPIVASLETENLLNLGTADKIRYDCSETFVDQFLRTVSLYPDSIAVVDGNSSITYHELDVKSDVLASYLAGLGIGKDVFVAIMLPRIKEFVVAVLGVWKAGGAYLPLGSEYPKGRIKFMLEDSEAEIVLTNSCMWQEMGDVEHHVSTVVNLDEFDFSTPVEPSNKAVADGLSYMIYTSGSTGEPKGVMLEHRNLRAFNEWIVKLVDMKAGDAITEHASFSFDGSCLDLYPALTVGGQVHILDDNIRHDLPALVEYFATNHIKGCFLTARLAAELLNNFDLPLEYLMAGGEKVVRFRQCGVRVMNAYGPTECTILSTCGLIDQSFPEDNIPLGRPVPNTYAVIVDANGGLVPHGMVGELCLCGPQISRGYWKRPELTAEKFCESPFYPGERMYHTGDIAYWNDKNELVCLGRIDDQKKLRGFRIELGEIEYAMSKIEGVSSNVVEIRELNGIQHLCAYYVSDSEIDEELLKSKLSEFLTDYMIPTAYIHMPNLPLTPNGKVDRKALPLPNINVTAYVAPETEFEILFCNIFADVLKLKKVGVNDSFFSIGGTSINAIRVVFDASKYGVKIVFKDVFEKKTAYSLAQLAETLSHSYQEANKNTDSTAYTIANIASLPDPISTETGHKFSDYNRIIMANTFDAFLYGERQALGDVLLTGATGFLGIHILHDLLMNYDMQIICLVRDKNGIKGKQRLNSIYCHYFGVETVHFLSERVWVVNAEITDVHAFDKINRGKMTVINCAASVKHFSSDNEIEFVNIESVRNLIDFCLRTDSRIIHISTLSVAGRSIDGFPNSILTENTFYFGQNYTSNKYVYSKFVAEELILAAILDKRLSAKIIRVGNLSPRYDDGKFQINFSTNNHMAMYRAYVSLGMIPCSVLDTKIEFSPIDKVAHAVLLLSETPRECIIFHGVTNLKYSFSDVLHGFKKAGITFRYACDNEFNDAVKNVSDDEVILLLRPLVAYNLNEEYQTKNIDYSCNYTNKVLQHLGYYWPDTNSDYVSRFVEELKSLGYFAD